MRQNESSQAITKVALTLLGRREHSRVELFNKLKRRGFSDHLIQTVIEQLAQKDWQSDQRFAEQYVRRSQQRGYGPHAITQSLKQRGIDEGLIEARLIEVDWLAVARQVRSRRFGESPPKDYLAQTKEMRFLQYRGFTQEQIYPIYKMSEP